MTQRYYTAALPQDLLGDWVLVKAWGRKGTSLGRVQHAWCSSHAEDLLLFTRLEKQRRQRGYRVGSLSTRSSL